MLITLAILILGFIVLSHFTADAVEKRQKEKYAAKFLQIPDVKKMSDFLYYEEHIFADIILTKNRFLSLWNFNEDSFLNTDRIMMTGVDNIIVICTDEKGTNSRVIGFDLVDNNFMVLEEPDRLTRKVYM